MVKTGVHITVLGLAAALLVAAPAPATPAASVPAAAVAAKKVPGRTLVVKVKGLPTGVKAKVTVKRKGVVRIKRVATKKRFTNLAPGKYRVKASKSAGFVVSPRSKKVRITAKRGKSVTFTYRATAAPTTVTGLKVQSRTARAVTLSWTNPANATSIVVRRAEGATPPDSATGGTAVPVTGAPETVTDDSVNPATTYSYSVFARNSAGTSGPASVTTRTPAVALVDGGANFTCGLDGTEKAYCWGVNAVGQLGNNSTTNSSIPVAVNTAGVLAGKSLTTISTGAAHACALADDGKPYCWGFNIYGQLGNGTTTLSTVPVAVDTSGVLAGKKITDISAGGYHTCVLADGALYCWGFNATGQLGNGTTTNSPVPVAVNMAGVLAGKTITRIAAGYSFTCVRDSDGKAYCWGANGIGQLGNNTTTNSSVPTAVNTAGVLNGKSLSVLSSGEGHACGLDSGAAYCWGYNVAGQLGNNTTTTSLVPTAVNTATVLSGRRLTDIGAGSAHTCALDDAGLSFCWGLNNVGQLGNNTTTNSSVAVPVLTSGVLNGKKLVQMAVGSNHTCAVASTGKVYCWGFNAAGQLGNGTTANSSVAVEVSGFGG